MIPCTTARPSSLNSFASNTNREVVWLLMLMIHDSTTPSSSASPSGAFTNTGSETKLPDSSHKENSFVSTFSLTSFSSNSCSEFPRPYANLKMTKVYAHEVLQQRSDFYCKTLMTLSISRSSLKWG